MFTERPHVPPVNLVAGCGRARDVALLPPPWSFHSVCTFEAAWRRVRLPRAVTITRMRVAINCSMPCTWSSTSRRRE